MRTLAAILTLSSAALLWAAGDYRSVWVDEGGQLHLILATGSEVTPRKLPDQVSFLDPKISPDGRTVGWLVTYEDPFSPSSSLAGSLVLYGNRRILHTFPAVQVFWDWQYRDGGKRVAYSTGPTHGGASECVLRDVRSGRVVLRWRIDRDVRPPEWARTLRM
jgi:hypothetical protein